MPNFPGFGWVNTNLFTTTASAAYKNQLDNIPPPPGGVSICCVQELTRQYPSTTRRSSQHLLQNSHIPPFLRGSTQASVGTIALQYIHPRPLSGVDSLQPNGLDWHSRLSLFLRGSHINTFSFGAESSRGHTSVSTHCKYAPPPPTPSIPLTCTVGCWRLSFFLLTCSPRFLQPPVMEQCGSHPNT